MPRRSSRISNSQPSTSRISDDKPSTSQRPKNKRLENSQSNGKLSQTRIDQHCALSESDIEELVDNCVRYFICNAGQNVYFRKADIQKHVLAKFPGHQFQQIIEEVKVILKTVYGYNLLSCDTTPNGSKTFLISNALPYISYSLDEKEEESKNTNKILLLLILSHIFMSNNSVSEASLFSFLDQLKIDTKKKDPIFGQVKEYITNVLVKQKYLASDTDLTSKKVTFSWGTRSEEEISKHEILKFVCKMYKDKTPKSWVNQFQSAEQQEFKNNRFVEDNSMDVDD